MEIELTYAIEAAGSRRPGGIMVSVFFLGVCCLLFFCVVHEVTVLVKKFESKIVKIRPALVLWFRTIGLMGLKQTFIRRV